MPDLLPSVDRTVLEAELPTALIISPAADIARAAILGVSVTRHRRLLRALPVETYGINPR
jgi:hypothetical protein